MRKLDAEPHYSVIYHLQVWGFFFLSGIDRDLNSKIPNIFVQQGMHADGPLLAVTSICSALLFPPKYLTESGKPAAVT